MYVWIIFRMKLCPKFDLPYDVTLFVSAIVSRLPGDGRWTSAGIDLYVDRRVRCGRIDEKNKRTDQSGDFVAQHTLVTAVVFFFERFDRQISSLNQRTISRQFLIVRLWGGGRRKERKVLISIVVGQFMNLDKSSISGSSFHWESGLCQRKQSVQRETVVQVFWRTKRESDAGTRMDRRMARQPTVKRVESTKKTKHTHKAGRFVWSKRTDAGAWEMALMWF